MSRRNVKAYHCVIVSCSVGPISYFQGRFFTGRMISRLLSEVREEIEGLSWE